MAIAFESEHPDRIARLFGRPNILFEQRAQLRRFGSDKQLLSDASWQQSSYRTFPIAVRELRRCTPDELRDYRPTAHRLLNAPERFEIRRPIDTDDTLKPRW